MTEFHFKNHWTKLISETSEMSRIFLIGSRRIWNRFLIRPAPVQGDVEVRAIGVIPNIHLGGWLLSAFCGTALLLSGMWPEWRNAAPSAERKLSETDGQPISLLKTGSTTKPVDFGVSVYPRSPERQTSKPLEVLSAPVAQGADAAHGFGIALGEAQAFSTLTERFDLIARMNSGMFAGLEARAMFIETDRGLTARLLAGPFTTARDATKTCSIIIIPNGIDCVVQNFEGDLISRQ